MYRDRDAKTQRDEAADGHDVGHVERHCAEGQVADNIVEDPISVKERSMMMMNDTKMMD